MLTAISKQSEYQNFCQNLDTPSINQNRRNYNMAIEEILLDIAEQLKESNRLKRDQNNAFEGYSLNEDYKKDTAEKESKEDSKETEQPANVESSKQDEPKPTQVADQPDEATMKKAVATIIKGKDNDKKLKLKDKIRETGAKKVTDIQPEHYQDIIDYVSELENA